MSVIVNLGCGTRVSPLCINYDWSPYARLARHPRIVRLIAPLIGAERAARLRSVVGCVEPCDLRRGIPLPDGSADAVYSSHVLEHFDRNRVEPYLKDIRRVLAPSGVLRIVVPDLHQLAVEYLEAFHAASKGSVGSGEVEERIGAMFEQSVRRRSRAVPEHAPEWIARAGTAVFGDARRRGETHQWMWDPITLGSVLEQAGFDRIAQVDCATSRIPNWDRIDLDRDGNREYKPGSLYLEAQRPSPHVANEPDRSR